MKAVASVLLLLVPALAFADDKQSPVGKKIENFTLRDYRGPERALAEFADKKLVVVAFLGCECPVSKLYALRLVELAGQYEPKGVAFLGVNSNRHDSITDITKFARAYKIPFPILKDAGNALADRFAAVRVPEVFVLDAGRVVRYWGRIDDQYGVGFARPKPEHRDLAAALDELLEGKSVSTPITEAPGCFIGRVTKNVGKGEVTYSKHIAPILQKHCVECHQPGEVAPFALTSYEESAGWAQTIRHVVKQERMPPWHADAKPGQFRNDTRMPDDEKQLLYQWVQDGAPEGNPKDLPPPVERAEGWRIPKPDMVISMPRPFKVPAAGTVVYQYFVVDTGFAEDKWVRAAEIRPGNRAVVHHTIVHVQPPDADPAVNNMGLASHWLAAQAPGSHPMILTDGLAKRIPAGSRILFQMHYTPNGVDAEDQTCIALTFADPKKVKKEVTTEMAANPKFVIPPYAAKHVVEADFSVREDSVLLAFMPHTHLRGSYFRYEAYYPDGKQEILLDVPRYDFNWQNTYQLAEPKTLPKGTRIHCVAHFNNSKSNYSNPDPSQTVRWGDQTWEEMMIGYLDLTPVHQDLQTTPIKAAAYRLPEVDAKLKELAGKALSSPEAFNAFAAAVKQAYPQVDRVDVTKVGNDKLQVVQASHGGQPAPFAGPGFEAPARACMLAFYALLNRYDVFPDLAKARGADLTTISTKTGLSSSLHAPVALDGAPATVNFWSKEANAFDKEKHLALRTLANAVAARKP